MVEQRLRICKVVWKGRGLLSGKRNTTEVEMTKTVAMGEGEDCGVLEQEHQRKRRIPMKEHVRIEGLGEGRGREQTDGRTDTPEKPH